MVAFMEKITNTPDLDKKIFDPILQTRRQEASSADDEDLSGTILDYVGTNFL